MDADAAVQLLLRRSWAEVDAAAADYIEEGERTVVRWEWSSPRAHLWERRLPAVGDEEPYRVVAEDPRRNGVGSVRASATTMKAG